MFELEESSFVRQEKISTKNYSIYLNRLFRDCAFIYPLDIKQNFSNIKEAGEYLKKIGISPESILGILPGDHRTIKIRRSALESRFSD